MHNDISTTKEITVLDRAIKARARRDRDGKKRRPVVDSLIEYAESQQSFLAMARQERDDLKSKNEAAISEISALNEKLSEQSEEIASLRAQLEQVLDAVIGVSTMVSEQTEA